MVFSKIRSYPSLTIYVVFFALFIDHLLLTAIIPVLPDLLVKLNVVKSRDMINWNDTQNSAPNRTVTLNDATSENDAQISLYIGIIVGIKSLVQIITNLVISKIIHRIGYTIPLFIGFIILSISSLFYVINVSFYSICITRGIQGIGSALASTSGLGLLAATFTEDSQRGKAMGIALGGIALGIVLGPVYGSIMYQFGGLELAFGIIAGMAVIGGLLEFISIKIKISKFESEETHVFRLMIDWKIAICAATIAMAIYSIVTVDTTLPMHMLQEWRSSPIERGAAFVPHYLSYMISTRITGYFGSESNRYIISIVSLIILAVGSVFYSIASSFVIVLLPGFLFGFAVGAIDASMFTQLGNIVDRDYTGCYGAVYAIADIAVNLGATLGPFINGELVSRIGFMKMFWVTGIIALFNAVLVLILQIKSRKNSIQPIKC